MFYDLKDKKVFLWDKQLNDTGVVVTWSSEVKDILTRNNMTDFYDQGIFPVKNVIVDLKKALLEKDQKNWQSKCQTLPKLRTFVKFKDFSKESPHIYKPLSFKQRKMMSKLRLGLLPLRLETARYIRPRIPPENRLCLLCNNGEIEDETHFLLFCSVYDQARQLLFDHIPNIDDFNTLNTDDKIKLLLNDPMMAKQTSKFITNSFDFRSTII